MKNRLVTFLIFICLSLSLNATEITAGDYNLELLENNGTFRFSVRTADGPIDLISNTDPSTSGFYIYEKDSFYSLGSSLRYRETYVEKDLGGVFSWNSKNLSIVQEFALNSSGELKIDLTISNKTEEPLRTGLKFLLDSVFEIEHRFAVSVDGDTKPVDSEWEHSGDKTLDAWFSGVAGDQRKALKVIPLSPEPDRLIIGNWDRLDKADFYYSTVSGRNFSNPPYSIDDSAVLHLYSPEDVLPGNSLSFSILLKAVDTVDDLALLNKQESVASESVAVVTEPVLEPEPEPEPVAEVEEEKVEIPAEIETVKDDVAVEPVETAAADEQEEDDEPEGPGRVEKINQILETVGDISDIIALLANPGMITETNLSKLEKLIDDLEVQKINEDTE